MTRTLSHEELIIGIDRGKDGSSRSCFSRFKIQMSLFDMHYISPNFIKNIDHDFVLLDPHGWDRTLVKKRKKKRMTNQERKGMCSQMQETDEIEYMEDHDEEYMECEQEVEETEETPTHEGIN